MLEILTTGAFTMVDIFVTIAWAGVLGYLIANTLHKHKDASHES
jgi:hypothetical protein